MQSESTTSLPLRSVPCAAAPDALTPIATAQTSARATARSVALRRMTVLIGDLLQIRAPAGEEISMRIVVIPMIARRRMRKSSLGDDCVASVLTCVKLGAGGDDAIAAIGGSTDAANLRSVADPAARVASGSKG